MKTILTVLRHFVTLSSCNHHVVLKEKEYIYYRDSFAGVDNSASKQMLPLPIVSLSL